MMMSSIKTLSDLPQEILVEIFSYLSQDDILDAGEGFPSEAVLEAIGNKRLWRSVDIKYEKMKKNHNYMGSHTTSLTSRNKTTDEANDEMVPLPETFLTNFKCKLSNLINLKINNFIIDTSVFKFSMLPETLESLVFENVKVIRSITKVRSPFYKIRNHLPKLENFGLIRTVCLTFQDIRPLSFYCPRWDNKSLISKEDMLSIINEAVKLHKYRDDKKELEKLSNLLLPISLQFWLKLFGK